MKRSFMLIGAAAIAASAYADFVDVTHKYLKDAAYLPGWQGVITQVDQEVPVAEVWNGAFRAYQVLPDMPAGEYTLTVNAFYRCGYNEFAMDNMKGVETTPELYSASIFINDNKKPVVGLFDEKEGVIPNSRQEANEAFNAGKYVNTVTANHPGGDLVIGIMNTGNYNDEWCAFTNFKLVGPNGEVAITNHDFTQGIAHEVKNDDINYMRIPAEDTPWNQVNTENKVKTPDMQKDGAGGGNYRKTGGSPYKYGQQVELPAGKYRYGMLCFHRYGSEVDAAGNYYNHKWPCDIRPEGAYGDANRTPKDWFEANDYDAQTEYPHAYIFMSKNEACPKDLNWDEDFGDLVSGVDARTRVKDVWEIHNGDLAAMPHNNPVRVEGNDAEEWADIIPYESRNKNIYRNDSGNERESAAAFVNDPEKYYQYVEFELTEPTKVWLGMGKNANSGDGYWHAWADQTLKMYVDNGGETPNDGEPVYFYSFENDDLNGAKIVGGGQIVDEGGNFGKVFQNAKGGMRENYLQLPEDVFVKAGGNDEFTISLWVNAKNAGESAEYMWCPMFTAYDSNVAGTGCPMFACQYRGGVQVNCNGNDNQGDAWCDYGDELCDQGKVTILHNETDWLADKEWHHYTATFTKTSAAVYFDGKLINSWTIDGMSRGQRCEMFGDSRFNLFCVGGMQAWNWGDPDPAFMFDDVAIYDKALNADQIKSIINAKVGEDNAVEDMQIDANAPVIYYDMQGVQVANPTHGIYIVRQGNKVAKKVIR